MATCTDYFFAHNLNATTIHTLADDLRRVYGGKVSLVYNDCYESFPQFSKITCREERWQYVFGTLVSKLGLNLQPPQQLPRDSDPYIDFELSDDVYIERALLAEFADLAEQKVMSVYEDLLVSDNPVINEIINEISEEVKYMLVRIKRLREDSSIFYQNYNYRASECQIGDFSLHTLSGHIDVHEWFVIADMLENPFSDPYFKEDWQALREERIKLYKYVKPIMANDHVYYLASEQDDIVEAPTEEEFLKRCRDAGLLIYNLSEAIMCPSKRPKLSNGNGWRVAIYDDFKDLRHDGTLL